jgi:DNA-binding transcriptional ArsR family regulator
VSDRVAKHALYDAFAEVAKVLSSGRRAEIVDVLAQGERSVEEIAVEIGQSVANTSHHLRATARAGVVATRPEGTRVYYRLASERVAELWTALRNVAAEQVAGLDRLAAAYLGDPDGLVLNATLGWWWADPVAALGIAGLALNEERKAWRGDICCD